MADIRINQLPAATGPTAPASTDNIAIDGTSTRRATIQQVVDTGAPIANQTEAQAGTNATKRMTPLTTKQSIASEVGVTLASAAQGAKADSAVQPEDLGNSASRNVGDTAGTVAAGDDTRIVNAVQYTLKSGDTNVTIQNIINSVPSGTRIKFRVPPISITLSASPSANGRIVTWDIDGGANITGPGFLPMQFTPSFFDYDNKKIQMVLSDGGPIVNATSRTPVAALNKYGGPAGAGLNPVAVFSHTKLDNTSGTAVQAAVFEVNDVGGWNGSGGNNFVEGVRTQALISANGGSGYGIVSFAGCFGGAAYHLLFGAEMGVHNEQADALPYNFFYADGRISSAFNATSSGTKKPDAYYTTNIFDPSNAQPNAAYLSAANVGVSGFAYAQTCTTEIGYDARYATLTYSLLSGPNNSPIRMQNAAKTADYNVMYLDTGNNLVIGQDILATSRVLIKVYNQVNGQMEHRKLEVDASNNLKALPL